METNHLNQYELARRWRMSQRTLERWRWQGLGPTYLKLGMRIVYRLTDIEAFEAARIKTPDMPADLQEQNGAAQ